MPAPQVTPPEVVEYIVRSHQRGCSAEEISAETQVPAHRVRQDLKDQGFVLRAALRSSKPDHLSTIRTLLGAGKTAPEIAETIGIPYNTVRRWLQEEGLIATSRRGRARNSVRQSILTDAEAGSKLYELASKYGIGEDTISKWLAEMGFHFRVGGQKIGKKPELLPEVLRLYDESISPGEIATRVGINETTVYAWLKDEGVFSRAPSTPRSEVVRAPRGPTPEQVEQIKKMYLAGILPRQIAEVCDTNEAAVRKIVTEEGILLQGGKYQRDREETTQALRYFDMGMSMEDVCEVVGRSYQVVRGWLVASGRDVRRRTG